jgi:hypothetical protein
MGPHHANRSEVRISHCFKESSKPVPYFPIHVRDEHPRFIPGMVARTSTRWFDVKSSKKAFTPIPFVHVSGHLSGSTLCFWTAYPQQIVASLTATVYQRLLRLISRRHSYKYAKSCRETLFKVSAYYVATRDDGFLNRVLGIFRKRSRRAVHNLYTFAFSNLGEDLRFVISQSCTQFLWLSFRSRTVVMPRSEKRDKSRDIDSSSELSFSLEMGNSPFIHDLGIWRKASQAWKTLHDYRRTTMTHSPLEGSSEFDVYLSETPQEY